MNKNNSNKEKPSLITNKKKLNFVMMIGISGAGKTTVANQIKEELNCETNSAIKLLKLFKKSSNNSKNLNNRKCVLLSSDDIRSKEQITTYDLQSNQKVFNIMNDLAIKSLKKNLSVIYDATNLTIKDRKHILSLIKENEINCQKIAYIIPTNILFAKAQNIKRQNVVPEQVIERQYKRFQFPVESEGFDDIEIHGCQTVKVLMHKDHVDLLKHTRKEKMLYESVSPYFTIMENFEQHNSHHDYLLGKHCELTSQMLIQKIRTKEIMIEKSFCNSLILAGYLHDYGKPFDFFIDERGEYHYFNHANIGTYNLLWLCIFIWHYVSWNTFLNVLRMVNYHMEVFQWDKMTQKTLNNKKEVYGENLFNSLKLLHEADIANSKKI